MSWLDYPKHWTLLTLLFACAGVALIFAIVFGDREQRHHDLRPTVERAREAAVEIISDGVERGVKRAAGEQE